MEVLSQKREADRVASRPSPPGLPGGPGHPPLPVPLAAALSTAIPAPPPPAQRAARTGPFRPAVSATSSAAWATFLLATRLDIPTPRTHLALPGTISPSHNRTRPRQQQRTVGPQNVCSVSVPRTHSASPGCTRPQKGPRLPTGLRREKETAVNGRGSGVCPTPRLRDQGPSSPTTRSLPLGESASLGAHIGSLLARPPGRAGARGPAASTPRVLGPRLQSDTDQSTASSRCNHPAQPTPPRTSPTAGATSLPQMQGAHVKGGKTFPRDLPARRAGPGPAKPLKRLKSTENHSLGL